MRKRAFVCFLIMVSVLVSLCVSVSAAESITASGFYDIESVGDVNISVFASEVNAETATVDVDSDGEIDVLYVDSDRMTVKYSAATIGAYYGVVLSKGSDLPVDESDIIYINQVEAKTNTITFDVYPILPTEKTELMLYISSGVEDDILVCVPLKYTTRDTYTIPSEYIVGDITADGNIDIQDAVLLFQHSMLPNVYPITYPGEIDFVADGSIDIKDAVRLFQYSMLPDAYPIS